MIAPLTVLRTALFLIWVEAAWAAALAAVVILAAVERLAAVLVDFRPGGSYGRTTQYDRITGNY